MGQHAMLGNVKHENGPPYFQSSGEEGKYPCASEFVQKPDSTGRMPMWHRIAGGFVLLILPFLSATEVVEYYGKGGNIYRIAGALFAEMFYVGLWTGFYCWFKPRSRSRLMANLALSFLLAPFLVVIMMSFILFFSERGQLFNFFELLFSLLSHGLLLGIGISMVLGKA